MASDAASSSTTPAASSASSASAATAAPAAATANAPDRSHASRASRASAHEASSSEAPDEQDEHESADDAQHASPHTGAGIPVPPEATSVTHHSMKADGRRLDYTATAGNLLLRNSAGDAQASVFYLAYTLDAKDTATRPVTFLFNGGPGAGSVFLMMGSFAPKRARTASPTPTGPAPYTLADNPDTLLASTDLVFVDAVGTGFSRIVGHASGKNFYGVDGDLDAFDQFIERYLTVNHRWNSPKYLLGESYGTTRAAMLAYHLSQHNVALNGVILMSSVLDPGSSDPGLDFRYESYLPSYAAIAWYHHKLNPMPPDLPAYVDEVRAFARGPYAQALAQGDALPDAQRDEIAARVAAFTGLDARYVKEANLRIWPSRFRKELLRDQSRQLGRYDARFEGIDHDDAGEEPDFDASVPGVSDAFNAALHELLANDLHYAPQDRYRVFNDDALRQWDSKHRAPWGEHLTLPYAAGDLAQAMRENPRLRVLSLNGYYDLATPFFATEYALAHMSLDRTLRGNVQIRYYDSGHMIYLDDASLHAMRVDLERFYAQKSNGSDSANTGGGAVRPGG
nr:peptidase S10 [Paraburkholderia phosphatilytica]